MTEREYFNSLSEEYIMELLRLNRGEEKSFMKKWGKKPAVLMNDITLVRKALEEGWTHNK